MSLDSNLLYDPKKRTSLLYSMTGQNPAFYPSDPSGNNQPPNYGTNFNPALGVTASGGSSLPSLPANYNFNDLANYETQIRNAYGKSASADILNTRDQLSKSLGDYGAKFFAQENPAILEDLNRRGLFQSPTAVNEGQANALKDIALSNEDYLRDFDTSALSARLQAGQDAIDAASNLRSTGLEANLQDAQSKREEDLANKLANKQGRNSLYNSLIGAGGSLGSSLLLGHILGGGAAAGAAGTAAVPAGIAGATGTTGATGTAAGAGGLGTTAGVGAIGAAGIGSALLSRAAQNKVAQATGSNAAGSAAGAVASPIGAQLNLAKGIISNPKQAISNIGSKLGIGAGKTANGNDIAAASTDLQNSLTNLRTLKSYLDNGQITQDQYNQYAQPIAADVGAKVQDYTGRGHAWADAINRTWNAFLNEGFISAQNGKWMLGKDASGPILWSNGTNWNSGAA